MTEITILSWRDIPEQIIVGKGRTAFTLPRSEKFEKAIDKCALQNNLKDSDSYLNEWK